MTWMLGVAVLAAGAYGLVYAGDSPEASVLRGRVLVAGVDAPVAPRAPVTSASSATERFLAAEADDPTEAPATARVSSSVATALPP